MSKPCRKKQEARYTFSQPGHYKKKNKKNKVSPNFPPHPDRPAFLATEQSSSKRAVGTGE